MEISTSTNICSFQRGRERLPVEFSIDECAKAGYRVLDMNFCIAMNPNSEMRGDHWADYVRHIGEYAAARNVRFTQSHLPYYDVGLGEQPFMEELIRRSIIGSSMLGVRWCVTHPFTVYNAGDDVQASQAENIRYYARHIATARQYGVGIALENDFEYNAGQPRQRVYCASVRELCSLTDAFDDPEHVGVCYDFGHAHLVGGFHRQNLRMIGSRLKAIHVQDNHGEKDEHLLPMYGSIDWTECMTALRENGWQGDLTFEAQEFGRYLPRELKHLAVELSFKIGQYLVRLFESAPDGI